MIKSIEEYNVDVKSRKEGGLIFHGICFTAVLEMLNDLAKEVDSLKKTINEYTSTRNT